MKDHNQNQMKYATSRVLRSRKPAAHAQGKAPTADLRDETVTKKQPINRPSVPNVQTTTRDENGIMWKPRHRIETPNIPAVNPFGLNSNSILHKLQNAMHSTSCINTLKQAMVQPYINQLCNFRVQTTASPFDRRVTAIEWHPTNPKCLAIASKSGDIVLWNYENTGQFQFSKGVGKGGSVTSMNFDLTDPGYIYTASIDGTVCRKCISEDCNRHEVFLNTADYNHWYCSVGVNYARKLILAGDNLGYLTMLEKNGGKEIWTKRRLHKSKVTHCEFNTRCDWLLVTASTDKTVKLWDLRKMSDRKSALYELPHDRPINSAYFSPDSTRLLTTDQDREIRIYQAPLWDRMERSIFHPHRFFQHITPIKATWHPIHDLVVIGRYPDSSFPGYHDGEKRSIDVFDAKSGELIYQILDSNVSGIISLNKFNPTGECLASGMGYTTLIWKDAEKLELTLSEKTRKNNEDDSPSNQASHIPDASSRNREQRRRRIRRRGNDDEDIGALKKQINEQLNTRPKTK